MKGKIEKYIPHIKKRLFFRFSQVEAMTSNSENGAYEIAFKNASKFDVVVSCGGDGTFNGVLNGVKKSGADSVVGILPYGTRNDVAKTLKIPRNLNRAIDTILRMNLQSYDLMSDGENYLTYSLSTGYLTKSTYITKQQSKKHFGNFAYFMSALKCAFKMKEIPLTVKFNKETIDGKFIYFMLLKGNNAGGIRVMKNSELDNGKFNIILIKKGKLLSGFFTFMNMFLWGIKSVKKRKNVIFAEANEVEIFNHSNVPFVCDGEKCKFLKKTIKIKEKINLIK